MVYETIVIATGQDGNQISNTYYVEGARDFTNFVARLHADYSIGVNKGIISVYSIVCFELEEV